MILDNLILEGPKKLVKNWSNIDTWPGHLPFRIVESIPGYFPGSGRSPFSPGKSLPRRLPCGGRLLGILTYSVHY